MMPGHSPIADPWIQQGVDEVDDQHGESNADDDQEDNPLDHEPIESAYGLEEDTAHAGIREDNLDQNGARDDGAQGKGHWRL